MKFRHFSFIAAASVLALASCSDDAPSKDGGENNPIVPEATTASYTVYKSDQSRVRNYGNPARSRASRSYDLGWTMPGEPTVPENIEKTTGITEGWRIGEGVDFLIPEGETFNVAFRPTASYYIKGTLDVTNGFWGFEKEGQEGTIYILPGGTLKIGSTLQANITIYNYGNLVVADNGITISENAAIYSAVDINFGGSLGVNGSENGSGVFYCAGTVTANSVRLDKGSDVRASAFKVTNEIAIDGDLLCEGSITATNVRLNGSASACSFEATNQITINSEGTINTSYFKANSLEMNAGNIILEQNGLIDADEVFITNNETSISVDSESDPHAVFATRKFKANDKDYPKECFTDAFTYDIKAIEVGRASSVYDLELPGHSADLPAYVPAGECHPAYGTAPETPGNPDTPTDPDDPTDDPTDDQPTGPTLVKVTDIDPLDPEHDHGIISATCIVADGGKLYASYHLRGNGQQGCIEVMEPSDEYGVNLTSYMITPDHDFNHLIVDNGKIITVGNHAKKGSIIASLPVGFERAEGINDDLTVKELTTDEVLMVEGKKEEIKGGYKNAGDGNCIIRHGNHYYVTTYKGYGVLNLDFSKVEGTFHETNGSSKHIAMGNGKIAVLTHNSYDKTSSTATVELFDANGQYFETALDSYTTDVISPVDGKNVVAIDGENVYACLSQGGLARLNDGTTFKAGELGRIPANGMAIDDKYIYAAMGSFVFVLDKDTMEEVTHYHASSLKSANYIALYNGLIYVAFGEDGIQVFRLNE